ncbi:glycoside hydrolase family 43 protein [Sphingomonas sp. RS2018]
MIERRGFIAGAGALALSGCVGRGAGLIGAPSDPLLFAYFTTGKGEALGLRFATSDDGFAFRALGGGHIVLTPQVGEKKLMRDPFLFRSPGRDAPYHLLWTTAWEGVTIGHATSRNLIDWTPQQGISVMADVPGTRNCWAPEAIVDPRTGVVSIFWSSTVTGRFTETAGTSESGYNHRIWATTTRDFTSFTPAKPFYDPGFSVIDATFATAPDGGLYLIVKDETREPPRKWLQVARAQGPNGPFGPLAAPFTPAWVEGPMTARVGDALVCYYDVYTAGRWGAKMTRDMVTWEDVGARLSMPAGARHGSLLRVPRSVIAGLEG